MIGTSEVQNVCHALFITSMVYSKNETPKSAFYSVITMRAVSSGGKVTTA